MITWMQRHRKYLVITIWISTIAFIGAGFVGWGQYSYGEKSGAVAKVGDISISGRELQNAYSQLFNRYSQMLQGRFDQEQAKKFGLDKQALRQLVNEALLLNLANSYNLEVSDKELANALQKQEAFHENGLFSKTLYQKVLKQNRLTPGEYEDDLRKSMLIRKVLSLFPIEAAELEKRAIDTASGIADRIEYKVLSGASVSLDTSDAALKTYWETKKEHYLTTRAFRIAYIEQPVIDADASDAERQAYFESHKYDFTGPDGKLLNYATAKTAVTEALNDKATNKAALKTYIAFKKEKLPAEIEIKTATVSEDRPLFSPETMQALAAAGTEKPYLKPKKEKNGYVIIKLVESIAPEPKSFAAAKEALISDYRRDMRAEALNKMATESLETFKGKTTDAYLKRDAESGFDGLDSEETQALLEAVFTSDKARGFSSLPTGKVVLYNIVDQKLETADDPQAGNIITQTKIALFNMGLLQSLGTRYETKVFIEGIAE